MSKKLDIDPNSIEDLGKVPDKVIAARLGCNPKWIHKVRKARGIPSHASQFTHIDWDSVPDFLTGDISIIAERLGCSPLTVKDARSRHIPGSRKGLTRHRRVDWDSVTDLGKMYDVEVAKKWGCSKQSVLRARTRLGIPEYKSPNIFDGGLISLEKSDVEIEREFGVPRHQVRYARKQHAESVANSNTKLDKKYGAQIRAMVCKRQEQGLLWYKEERTCLCGKRYKTAIKHQKYCSEECSRAYKELLRLKCSDKNEEVNAEIFKMFISLNQRLSTLIKTIRWEEKVTELLKDSTRELSRRYDISESHIRSLKLRYRKKEGMTNETQQTQSIDDPAR
jgi:DNA-binding CsgD family transcriptional regulator